MPPTVVLLALLPLLGACGALQSTPDVAGRIEDARDALREREGLLGEADRAALEAAIAAYNDAGIDPVRLDAEQLRYWDLACVTMLVVDPDPVLAGDCDLVRRALARAPVQAPRAGAAARRVGSPAAGGSSCMLHSGVPGRSPAHPGPGTPCCSS